MSINHNNMLSEFPFYNLDNQEFLRITGGWVHHTYHSLIESKDLFQDIIASPEKEVSRMNKYHGFSMIYFNKRRLPKNLTSLNDLILIIKETPEIIAISETKLQDENIYNISIPGMFFLNTNSPTRAGGVGLYISQELTFIRRGDLEITVDGIESCGSKLFEKKKRM